MMNRMAIAAVMPATGPDLGARDLGERAPAAPRRGPQDDEVVHRAGEADAGDEPDQPGREAELRRQHRPDSGPAPVMAAKWWPKSTQRLVGMVVVPVVPGVRRRRPRCRRAP